MRKTCQLTIASVRKIINNTENCVHFLWAATVYASNATKVVEMHYYRIVYTCISIEKPLIHLRYEFWYWSFCTTIFTLFFLSLAIDFSTWLTLRWISVYNCRLFPPMERIISSHQCRAWVDSLMHSASIYSAHVCIHHTSITCRSSIYFDSLIVYSPMKCW